MDIPKEDISRALKLGARKDCASSQYYISEDLNPEPFSAWILASSARLNNSNSLSLTELLSRVEETVSREMPNYTWVRLEVSYLERKNGHIYLDVVERDPSGNEISKARANIWASQVKRIEDKFTNETGIRLRADMKLLVSVKVNFHTKFGFSLTIIEIDAKFTLGDMQAKLRRIREALVRRGESTMNRDLKFPFDITNIAVISPDNAAGLGDFRIEADKLAEAGICRFSYFTATFQGHETTNSMREAFKSVHESNMFESYDVLVLIRGGGLVDDLHWLNDLTIARLVCRIPIPVFTGIGHEKDSTILDECANRSFGTPSKVIGHIRELIFTRAIKGSEDWNYIQQWVSRNIKITEFGIDQNIRELKSNVNRIIDDAVKSATLNLTGIVSRAGSLEAIAESRLGSINDSILDSGRSSISIACSSVSNLIANVNERSNSAVGSFQLRIDSAYASIKLASRRSIDGIDEHIINSHREVVASAFIRTNRVSDESIRLWEDVNEFVYKTLSDVALVANENFRLAFFDASRAADSATYEFERYADEISRSALRMIVLADEVSDVSMHDSALIMNRFLSERELDTDRYLNDLKYFMMRSVGIAEQSIKDYISGIVAMGVEPTLKRGFAVVYSGGKPVTTKKEAEKHYDFEVCFNDGLLNVTKREK